MRKFEISVNEVVEDEVLEGYRVTLIDGETGEIIRESKTFGCLNEVMDALAKLQYEWYEELRVDAREDEWRIRVDVTL